MANLVYELERLAALRDRGLLSNEEFVWSKSAVIRCSGGFNFSEGGDLPAGAGVGGASTAVPFPRNAGDPPAAPAPAAASAAPSAAAANGQPPLHSGTNGGGGIMQHRRLSTCDDDAAAGPRPSAPSVRPLPRYDSVKVTKFDEFAQVLQVRRRDRSSSGGENKRQLPAGPTGPMLAPSMERVMDNDDDDDDEEEEEEEDVEVEQVRLRGSPQ
eukprot:Rhum_TRINITY_DN14433_c12_g1::Rhum_TRINITY_DN14433_c12_g1_i2::g.91262::m.91262